MACARGGSFHFGELFDTGNISGGMNVRANSANAFQQVDILRPVAVFRTFFNAAMDVSQTDRGSGDDFTIHCEFKVPRFLQGRVLGTDGNDKLLVRFLSDHPVHSFPSVAGAAKPVKALRSG